MRIVLPLKVKSTYQIHKQLNHLFDFYLTIELSKEDFSDDGKITFDVHDLVSEIPEIAALPSEANDDYELIDIELLNAEKIRRLLETEIKKMLGKNG